MGDTITIFYCIIVIPLLFSVLIVGKRSRKYIIYLIIGFTCCLIASVVNSFIRQIYNGSYLELTTTCTPIVEEILKALPVFYYGMIFSDDKDTLVGIGFATGVGFAILENGISLLLNGESVSIMWALLRGFSTSLMHAMTTALMGLGLSFIKKRKKMALMAIFSFLTLAIVYHATFNELVQSEILWIAIIFPFITFVCLLFLNTGEMAKKYFEKLREKNEENRQKAARY